MANNLTRKEIAKLIGKGESYVGTYVRRGHLTEKNKRIDTDLKKNKIFLSKFITKEIERKIEQEPDFDISKIPINGKYGNLDIELKEHELELKKIKIQKEKLDLTKKQAKLIELLEAKDIMSRAIVVLSSQYRQNAKLYLLELAAKYNIPDSDLAGIQKWFDDTINKSIKESKDLIKAECRIVADGYSESLNVGESEN